LKIKNWKIWCNIWNFNDGENPSRCLLCCDAV